MKFVNQNDRMKLWAVTADGRISRLGDGTKRDLATIRDIVIAASPDEALNSLDEAAFKVGIKNATPEEPAEISIYGEIGDPWQQSDAGSVNQFLRANKGKPINVKINSPGGLAYDGITIHNALLQHDGSVTTTIEGMAGSAASIIAMAGQPAKIYENAQLFIHRAAVLAIGNRDAMAEAMDWLDQIDEAIARTYKAKTGKALDKIMSMMIGKMDGTLFSAREAVAEKFCNEVVQLKRSSGSNSVALNASPVGSVHSIEYVDADVNRTVIRNAPTPAQTQQFVESARALRIRSRSEMFLPAGSEGK